jgi:hypothetical protein
MAATRFISVSVAVRAPWEHSPVDIQLSCSYVEIAFVEDHFLDGQLSNAISISTYVMCIMYLFDSFFLNACAFLII